MPLLVKQGLRATWLTFAIVSVLLTLVTWNGWPEDSNEKHRPNKTIAHKGKKQQLWHRAVILLLISYACNAVGFVPHTVFWVDFISRGLHMGIEAGTRFWILLGLAAAFGPLITGFIADKLGFAKSIRLSLAVKAFGVILPLFSTAVWSLALSSICVGSLALGITSLASGRTTELVSHDKQKQVWSGMTIAFSVTHAATAYLLSYLFSVFHSYYLLFEIGAVTLLLGSILDYAASNASRTGPC